MALDIGQIVRVTDRLVPDIAPRRGFGRTLFVRSGSATAPSLTNLDEVARDRELRAYGTFQQLAEDFDASDAAYAAGQAYFAQRPYPGDLLVGTMFASGRAGISVGKIRLTRATLRAGATLDVLGQTVTIASNTDSTAAATATRLQNALNAVSGWSNWAVAVSGTYPGGSGNGDMTMAVTVPTDVFANANPNVAELGGDEVTKTWGFGLPIGAVDSDYTYVAPVNTASGIADVLDDFRTRDDGWYWFALDNALHSGHAENASQWAESSPKVFAFADNQFAALSTNDAASRLAVMFAADRQRTMGIYSATRDYKELSAAALFSSVDYEAAGSLLTADLATLPNTLPDTLTNTQVAELRRKRVNFYTTFGGDNAFREGWTFDAFADVRAFLDWLSSAIQTSVYTLLRQSRRVAMTAAGLASVRSSITEACQQGVRNGGITPGRVSEALRGEIAATTGASGFNGRLTTGYLVHVPSAGAISEADRAARTLTGVRVFANGSAAIHNVEIDLTFR